MRWPRNPALEARLLEEPDDRATRAVLADWLQSVGDPWGELLALELAGKPVAAERFRHANRLALGATVATRTVWSDGFLVEAHLDTADAPRAAALLPELLELRTAILLRKLNVAAMLEAREIELLSTRAPRTLRNLFTWLAPSTGSLALPHLIELELYLPGRDPVAFDALLPLLDGTRLPSLRKLQLFDEPVPRGFVEALLGSRLLAGLEWLVLEQNALAPDVARLILERRDRLAHLRHVSFDVPDELRDDFERAFAGQLRHWLDRPP